jgi:hypothetical protein
MLFDVPMEPREQLSLALLDEFDCAAEPDGVMAKVRELSEAIRLASLRGQAAPLLIRAAAETVPAAFGLSGRP